MLRKASILLLALLVGCNYPNKAADGYVFGKPTFKHEQIQLSVILLDNQEAVIRELAKRKDGYVDKTVIAFSSIGANTNTCTIYMIDPAKQYLPEFIGHELVHCIYGQWHE